MDRGVKESPASVRSSQSQAAVEVVRQSVTEWWDHWFGLAALGVIWLLACLTIILAPPATLGLADAIRSIPQGQAPSVADWWKSTRRYFGQAWLMALLNLLLAFLFWTNFWFYTQLGTPLASNLRWVFLPLTILWLIIQLYAVAFLLEQERKNVGIALRNGFYLVLAAPLYTLIVGGVGLGLLFFSILLIVPLVLGSPALILLLSYFAVSERIAAYQLR